MSDLLEKEKVTVHTDSGDHDKFSHYCRKEDIENAILSGIPTTALCGKKWLPQSDPARFSVCPECKDIFENVVGSNL